nr:serine dehydratase beta chain [Porphyromonas cangingivalis]
MGPKRAAELFVQRQKSIPTSYKVTLYGALAATGKGHLTDVAILGVLAPLAPTEIVWEPKWCFLFTPTG